MDIREEIRKLKKERNALILAHYYQTGDIQDIADHVGDSLALARIGAEATEDIIVLCGVRFMAETAKILSPEKKVLLPNPDAGCPMADMADAAVLAEFRKNHPEYYIVSYVNTNADVKALTDVCVTSSNALDIVRKIESDKIMFLPDRNLGGYIRKQLNRKGMELWEGFCHVHNSRTPEEVLKKKVEYPDALVLVHPECTAEVVELADFVGSTKGIIDYARESEAKRFIIVTEQGIMHPLSRENPGKEFFIISESMVCTDMKKVTMEEVYDCLRNLSNEVVLDPAIIEKAKIPLQRMLEYSKKVS